jgi:tetratricopeptide (TPR) repeat protein
MAGFRISGNARGEVLALFNRYRALFGLGDYEEALTAIRHALAHSTDTMVAPHELGQLLMWSAEALQATGAPEEERRAALEAAATAFDEAGLPHIGDTARQAAERKDI